MSENFDLLQTPIQEGTTLVEASAGTGKTYCLTGLVLRMLLEGRVTGIGQLLVVTFTKAATEELTTRIRNALTLTSGLLRGEVVTEDPFYLHLAERHSNEQGREIIRLALLNFDELLVVTIHGFAKRILEQSAFESGLPFQQEFLENDDPLLLEVARDTWRCHLYGASDLVATVVAQRRLTPRSFLEDHARWRRHPKTRIEPVSDGLQATMERLEEAAERLRQRFERLPLQAFLGRLNYLAKAKMDRLRIQHLLGDLEAFCNNGNAAGLAAIRQLSWSQLKKQVRKADQAAVQHHPMLAACESLNKAAEDLEAALRVTFIHEVEERFNSHKERAGILSFDDLLHRLHAALRDPRRGPFLARTVRQQIQVALIDEFQDTDLVQYEIFRRLFGGSSLYLIGDPKQAIYRFRGADVFAYMAAKNKAQRTYTLGQNWRSTHKMVAAVGAIFQESSHPFVFDEIPFEPVSAAGRADETPLGPRDDPALTWLWLDDKPSKREAIPRIQRAVAAEVRHLLESGVQLGERSLAAGDIAILTRTNEQAQGLQEALHEANIPAVIGRAGDVFDSEEMMELERLLQAIGDPAQGSRLRAALTTRLWGDCASDLERLAEDDDAWQQRVESLEGYRELWRRRGFMPMMQQLIDEQEVRSRLLVTHDGERRITNLLHAVEILHRAAGEGHLSPAGLLQWLENERRHRGHDTESAELRLESDARAVQIATIHKSKGLEYAVVFCPFLWEGRPLKEKKVLAHLSHQEVVYDCGSDNFQYHRSLADAEQLAEDLRLTYVALTRARYRTYVVWGQIGQKARASSSPLAWLLAPALGVPGGLGAESAHQRIDRVRKALQQRWDSSWKVLLQDFVHRHGGLMELRVVEDLPIQSLPSADATRAQALQCRSLSKEARRRLKPWGVVSFSSLSRGEKISAPESSLPLEASLGDVTVDSFTMPPLGELPDHTDPSFSHLSSTPVAPQGLFAFAQGPRAGTCLHHVLEECDFQQPNSEKNRLKIAEVLQRHGLHHPDAHRAENQGRPPYDPQQVVLQMLQRLASAPFPRNLLPQSSSAQNLSFKFSDVSPSHQKVEWSFFLPLGPLVPSSLASLFRKSGRGRVAKDYAPRLAHLDSQELEGFLTGFVDLIFVHQGRWFVVDWKSNHLGHRAEDYGDQFLWAAMQHHHYVLQYHLYVLALHLFLEQRLPDYDYEQHFGGVAYVFLRGLQHGEREPPLSDVTGWYIDRPPISLVDSLLELVDRRDVA